jgi:hypothetical protein
VFRLWRDLGYAVGALITRILADTLGINWAVGFIGFLTIISSFIILMRMKTKQTLEMPYNVKDKLQNTD